MSFITFPSILITGDCSNTSSGVLQFEIVGGSPDWIVYEGPSVSGLLPTSAVTSLDPYYYVNNLPVGNYNLTIQDSDLPPTIQYLSFTISSGVTVSLTCEGTTCNLNNGSITATTETYVNGTEIYLYDILNNYIDSGTTSTLQNYVVFNNLSPDSYYVDAFDYGGCSGTSESCVIRSSTNFTFGYYKVNSAGCVPGINNGKIYITGLTNPTSAYTINWLANVNGQTGTTVTGLTQGLYPVEITNSEGCTNVDYIQIDEVQPIQIISVITQQPTCLQPDGELSVVIDGGTAPYYYSGSNNDVSVTFDTNYTFTGLSSGQFSFSVTDSALCTVTGQYTLSPPNSFASVDLITTNSNCNANNGILDVYINNGIGSGNYTFTLSGANGTYISNIVGGVYKQFASLGNGSYTLFIDNNLGCVYTGTTSISSVDKFVISASTTGTTCGLSNGKFSVSVSSGATFPIVYSLTGPTNIPFQFNGNFNGLPSGNYTLSVTDSTGCVQYKPIFITPSSSVYFDFVTFNPVFGNDGEIDVLITSGTPPFTFNWTGNVGLQTGLIITGLTSGAYSCTVIDSNGCSFTRTTKLKGTEILGTYTTFEICEGNFQNSELIGKRGIKQMFNEGFYDLTSGDTNCIVNEAKFSVQVTVGAETKQDIFYISSGLNDFPNDQDWGLALKNILETFVGIGEVIIDYTNNKITITNDCSEIEKNCRRETYNLLNDTKIISNLVIEYNISCVSCD